MKRLLILTTASLTLALAPPATAGTYTVSACMENPNDGAAGNGSWAGEIFDPFVTTSTSCPGSGIATRLNLGSGNAWHGATARHSFIAPAGNRIIGITADIQFNSTRGWFAGLVDGSSWITCATNCSSLGQWERKSYVMNTPHLFAQVTCGSSSGCPHYAQDGYFAMKNITVTIADDVAPSVDITGGSVTQPGWHTGDQTLQIAASDPSGIRTAGVYVNGERVPLPLSPDCDPAKARQCSDLAETVTLPAAFFRSDSSHVVAVQAFDAAGNDRWTSHRVSVDRTPPAQPQNEALDGDGSWRAANHFAVSWRNPAQIASPIEAAWYTICPETNRQGFGNGCVDRVVRGRDISRIEDLSVPGAGEWRMTLWLQDGASNADRERSVSISGLRFDDEVPTVAIAPLDDDDPTRIRVLATDHVSGISRGEIEVRRRGEEAWRTVPVALEESGLSAIIDDEVLPKGTYEVRARVIDRAGNERSTQAQSDGQPATRTLPLRVATRLVVGKPARVRARGTNGTRRYRTVLRVRPSARFGRTIPLTGRLTMPGGNPLASANVEVWERVELAAASWKRVGEVRTDRSGRFRFKALQGPSRTLKFRYPGTTTIRARSTRVDLRVRAVTSLRVSRSTVVNGEEVRFFGRLKGRQYGTTGKLIHVQVYTRGHWSTFATPRANRRTGRWSMPYRFTATRGLVRYRFRALVPREASFPYETGGSRSRTVKVRGL